MINKTDIEKFNKIVTKQPSQWRMQYEKRKKNRTWAKKSAIVALNVLTILKEKKWSQKQLAEKMGVSAQQVNKIVKGKENFTFETISKLENALEFRLFEVTLIDREREQRNHLIMLEWLESNVSLSVPIYKSTFDKSTEIVSYLLSTKQVSKRKSFINMKTVNENILRPTG